MTSIIIPASISSIEYGSFSGCGNPQSMTLPFVGTSPNLRYFADNTSYNTTSMHLGAIFGSTAYTGGTKTSVTYTTTNPYGAGYTTQTTTLYIPASLKEVTITGGEIYTKSFMNCSQIHTISVINHVTIIRNAFSGCTGIKHVTIGCDFSTVGEFYVFKGCTNLQSAEFTDSVTSIGGYAFWGCTGLTSVTIPDSVTTIGNYAFYGCTSLTSVTIPDSVTSIGGGAFYGCTSLTSVTIPDSVTSIGGSAFRDCIGLKSVTIPDNVTEISVSAFEGCTELKSVVIGSKVTSIGKAAFNGCTKLKYVYYRGSSQQWSKISIGTDNTYLKNATITYNYTGA
jgi:hypothetical protein